MEIKRGKYILCSDASCCWIEEEKVSKDTGKTRRECTSGYYPNFRMLADAGLPSHLVRDTEGKSMRKVIEELKKKEEKIGKMTLKRMEELGVGLDTPLRGEV